LSVRKIWRKELLLVLPVLFSLCEVSPVEAQSCGSSGLAVQVLGSGGPELQDKRASSSYLIWEHGAARVIVDAGGGSARRFGESGAQMSQVDVVLFSHFQVDHGGDFPLWCFLPGLKTASALCRYTVHRETNLCRLRESLCDLFSEPRGAWRYLSDLIEKGVDGSYTLGPHDVVSRFQTNTRVSQFRNGGVCGARHSWCVPALAWRVELEGKRIVFSGDTSAKATG